MQVLSLKKNFVHLTSHMVVPSQASLIFVKNSGVVGQYLSVSKLPACSEQRPKFLRPQKAEIIEMCLNSLHLSQAVSSSHFTVPFCVKTATFIIKMLQKPDYNTRQIIVYIMNKNCEYTQVDWS